MTWKQNIISINELSPLLSFWTIIGFVLFKSPLRTFNSKSGGKGYLFTFDVKDVSGEIRVTSFNAKAQKFFEIIELHQFYSISFATVIKTRPEFKQLKNDFEIRSTPYTIIEKYEKTIPQEYLTYCEAPEATHFSYPRKF